MRRITHWLCTLSLTGAAAAPALAQTKAPEDYSLYAILPTNKQMTEKYGRYLEDYVEFENSPIDHRGMRILNAGFVGNYPFAGIHLVESDPNYMARHLENVRKRLHRFVAADYDGVIAVDYESWWAAWDHTRNVPSGGGPADRDHDYKDDWRDFIERYRPEVIAGKTGKDLEIALRDSYEEATVRFLVATIRECKKVIPNATWGYYNYPKVLYHSPLTAPGVKGYGDLSHYASQVNDRLAPLWAEVDGTFPRIYPVRQTVLERADPMRDNLPKDQYLFLATHVHESKRVAPHAICIPFGATRYWGGGSDLAGVMLNERNTHMQFTVPREAGADGVVMWGDVMYDQMAQKHIDYMNNTAIPIANELWDEWYPERSASRPPSVSGGKAEKAPTAGGEKAVPTAIPAHLRIRYSRSFQQPTWGAIRRGSTRVSIPAHSPTATASNPVHRGGRIVSRRAVGTGESPPQHRPALTGEPEGE